jgi:hypothetical protein
MVLANPMHRRCYQQGGITSSPIVPQLKLVRQPQLCFEKGCRYDKRVYCNHVKKFVAMTNASAYCNHVFKCLLCAGGVGQATGDWACAELEQGAAALCVSVSSTLECALVYLCVKAFVCVCTCVLVQVCLCKFACVGLKQRAAAMRVSDACKWMHVNYVFKYTCVVAWSAVGKRLYEELEQTVGSGRRWVS